MSKFFKSRNVARKYIPDDVSQIKRNLEQEIEKEVAIMTVAMPFLPKDQVRGLVLRKLGLQNGKNKNSFLRTGGGRIDYKRISLEFPQSLDSRESTSVESPRSIRKKLLGRSQLFCIVGYPAKPRNEAEGDAMNDTFGFSQASPTDKAPRPYERKTQVRRPRKTLKRRLFTITDDEDDTLLGGIENIAHVESRPAKPYRRNIFTSTPKKTTEEAQQLRRNDAAQIRPNAQEPLSETRRPICLDSEEQTTEAGGFTHNSEDENVSSSSPQSRRDETSAPENSVAECNYGEAGGFSHDSSEDENVALPSPQSRRGKASAPENSLVESNYGEALMGDNSSPVLNGRNGKDLKWRRGLIGRITTSTSKEPINRETLNRISPTPVKGTPRRDTLYLRKKSATNKQTEHLTLSGTPRNVSPIPAIGVSPVQVQPNSVMEILESPEEVLMDTAVVPEVRSDAASTSVTPPVQNNAHSLVTETPSEARINLAVRDNSDKIPGGSLSSDKDYYSATPQSLIVAPPREMPSAYSRQCLFNSASQTLWRQVAAPKQHSPGDTSTISSSFQSKLQEKNSILDSSETSARHNNKHNFSTPDSARADTPRGKSPSRSTSSTFKSTPTWVRLPKASAGTQAQKNVASESERAVAPRKESPFSSENITSQPTSQEHLRPCRKQGWYAENAADYSPVRGSSAENVPLSHESNGHWEKNAMAGSGEICSASSIQKDHNYHSPKTLMSVNTQGSTSSGSTSTTPKSASQEPLRPYLKQSCYRENAADFAPVRGSSAEIIPSSHESNSHWEKSATAASSAICSGEPFQKGHKYHSPKIVKSVNARGSTSFNSKNTTPESASQKSLRPYLKQSCYRETAADYSPVRDFSAEIFPSFHESNTQWNKGIPPDSGETCYGSSIQNDHNYDSPKSVVSVNTRASSSSFFKNTSPEYTNQTTYWKHDSGKENAVYSSTDHRNAALLLDEMSHSSDFEETPITSFQPRYGLFKKGIPRINQIPDEKMTARRTMFQSEDLGTDLDLSQEKNPEEHAVSQDLFKSSEVNVEISDDEMFLSKHSLLPYPLKQISVVPLLLRRGADRVDGLPFPSGEAVRPFSAEWLHQKKLNSQSDSTPSTTVERPRSTSGNRNDWRSDESLVVDMTNSRKVPLSQAISSPLFSEDPFLSMVSTLPVTTPQEQSSLQTDKWWNEGTVLHALSQLGMEAFSNTGVTSSEMQLTFGTGQNSSPNPSLVSQESDAQCSSPESVVKRTL